MCATTASYISFLSLLSPLLSLPTQEASVETKYVSLFCKFLILLSYYDCFLITVHLSDYGEDNLALVALIFDYYYYYYHYTI